MQNDFLGCFFRRQVCSIDDDFCLRGCLVRIRNSSEFLHDSSSRLCVQTLAVPNFTNIDWGRHMDQNKAAIRLDHLSNSLPGSLIGSYRSADRDTAVFCYLRRGVADSSDIDVTVLFGKAKLGGKMLSHQVAVEKRDGSSAHLEELGN